MILQSLNHASVNFVNFANCVEREFVQEPRELATTRKTLNNIMIILVLNCGSSSIKYQVMDVNAERQEVLAKGQIERIGLPEGRLNHKPTGKDELDIKAPIPNHTKGIEMIFGCLTDPVHGAIDNLSDVQAVGHRVAHGGEYFKASARIDAEVVRRIEECVELAPLHNPANLKGIAAIEKVLPGLPQVAVFDTSFHQTIPARNFMYALPYRYYDDYKVRKYGFHGTSHQFVAKKACAITGLDFHSSRIITCHIGNGASITAIQYGKSVDTSMGFTPVDGLIMGTRCGDVDPGALIYIAKKEGLDYDQLNDLINKQSGVNGFTGISSDMRDIKKAADDGDAKAILILEMYCGRIKKYIGQYAAVMGGADIVVFTGGVGENGPETRSSVCEGLEFMGLLFDEEVNRNVRSKDRILSAPDSKVKVVVAMTDEERVIAQDTFEIVS